GPALFTGVIEQARAMLDMAIAACRDPDPGAVGEALETIGSALSAADALLEEEDGVRAAIDLVFRANVCAATELPDAGCVRRRSTMRRPTRRWRAARAHAGRAAGRMPRRPGRPPLAAGHRPRDGRGRPASCRRAPAARGAGGWRGPPTERSAPRPARPRATPLSVGRGDERRHRPR